MTQQTEERIPSKTLNERILELAGEFSEETQFDKNMFDLLLRVSRLRLSYVQNYLDYSVAERRDVSGLLEQVDRLYDDHLQIVRNREYHRLLKPKPSPEARI